jgi:uncharacterized membrane protein YhaH (DUF805 family)
MTVAAVSDTEVKIDESGNAYRAPKPGFASKGLNGLTDWLNRVITISGNKVDTGDFYSVEEVEDDSHGRASQPAGQGGTSSSDWDAKVKYSKNGRRERDIAASVAIDAAIYKNQQLGHWYWRFWTHAFDFKGRSRRRDYWLSELINFGIGLGLSLFDAVNNRAILTGLFIVALIIPRISIGIRRLHDIGKSGYWYLMCYIVPLSFIIFIFIIFFGIVGPFSLSTIWYHAVEVILSCLFIWFCVGEIILLCFSVRAGQVGFNVYGPDPKRRR